MAIWVFITLLLSMSGYSSAAYCVCKVGGDDATYQKVLDYACGAGADCTPILQGGPCFEPDNVKAHCDYAVNSYFQKSGQVQDSCNFAGVAALVNAVPTTVSSGCTYPASPGQAGSSAPTTGSGTSGGGGVMGSPGTTTGSPGTTTGSPGTTGSTTGSPGTAGSTTGSTVFGPGTTGLAPTALGFNDSGAAAAHAVITTFLQLILVLSSFLFLLG